MKTSTEIAKSISENIAHIFLRPSMHVGSTTESYSANALDALLFALHYQWAFAREQYDQFREIVDEQRKVAKCGSQRFADSFRHNHADANHREASRFVLRNWRNISISLGMPLDDGTGRNAADADF